MLTRQMLGTQKCSAQRKMLCSTQNEHIMRLNIYIDLSKLHDILNSVYMLCWNAQMAQKFGL